MIQPKDQFKEILSGLESESKPVIETNPVESLEQVEQPEQQREQTPEKLEQVDQLAEGQSTGLEQSTQATAVSQPIQQTQVYRQVEGILAEGLADAYQGLSPVKKQEFKKVGEETALSIAKMVNSAKFKLHKIFELIVKWLSIIPGINKYFLEQEAKIKADKILALKNLKDQQVQDKLK